MDLIKESYDELDRMIHKNVEEEAVAEKFQEIVEMAIEIINVVVDNEEQLDINVEEHLYALRGMYDYMLELWNEEDYHEAKEIGYDMLDLVEDDLVADAFSFCILGMLENLSPDTFFAKYVDMEHQVEEQESEYEFFYVHYKDEIEELKIKHGAKFSQEYHT